MPFVVSLYHGIKRQVNGKNYCRSHKKKNSHTRSRVWLFFYYSVIAIKRDKPTQ